MSVNPPPPFQAFTTTYTGIANRIVVPIQVADAFDPRVTPSANPEWCQTQALWDTGATNTVITGATAAALKLVPPGVMRVTHAGGTDLRNTYVINVLLPNRVLVTGIQASDCHNTVGNFGMIVGMDIISKGDLAITNFGGKTCMTFRIPSVERIDYVQEFNRRLFAGTSPNAPCPCGAVDANGKPVKFKRCHRANV